MSCSALGTDERDFRSLGWAAQEELQRRAPVRILRQGLSQAKAARVAGVQRQTVNIWRQRYRAQGADGVLDGRRGKGLLGLAPLLRTPLLG